MGESYSTVERNRDLMNYSSDWTKVLSAQASEASAVPTTGTTLVLVGSSTARLMSFAVKPSNGEAEAWEIEVWGQLKGAAGPIWVQLTTLTGTGSAADSNRLNVDEDYDEYDLLVTTLAVGTLDCWVRVK